MSGIPQDLIRMLTQYFMGGGQNPIVQPPAGSDPTAANYIRQAQQFQPVQNPNLQIPPGSDPQAANYLRQSMQPPTLGPDPNFRIPQGSDPTAASILKASHNSGFGMLGGLGSPQMTNPNSGMNPQMRRPKSLFGRGVGFG